MIALVLLVAAGACDAKGIASSLSTQPQVHCRYTQTKTSKLFKRKMQSNGELWVTSAGSLRFDTLAPSGSAFVVKDGVAKMKNGGDVDTLPLDKLPKVNAFLGAFSGLFVGKLKELEKEFSLACADAATLVLQPKGDAFQFLDEIRLGVAPRNGSAAPKSLELAEKNGDRSVIVLDACDAVVPPGTFDIDK